MPDPLEKARASALASLALREHSSVELRNKLVGKGHDESLVDELLLALQQQNFLSDQRFAESYWRTRSAKGYGPMRIAQELKLKGIDATLVQTTRQTSEIDFFAVLSAAYEKKYRGAPLSDRQDAAKRMNYLYRRGFPTEMIRELLGTF